MPWSLRRIFLAASVPVVLEPRQALFHAGDRGDGCYLLRRGSAKAAIVARDGQERLLAVFGPGALIGELALIDDEPRSATVTALRRCRLRHLTKARFFQLADANPHVYRQALRILAHRLREANANILAQGTATVTERVARAFILLCDSVGEAGPAGAIVLTHRISQADIAALAGVARENASRAINGLLRQGLLAIRQCLVVLRLKRQQVAQVAQVTGQVGVPLGVLGWGK